jgi:Uma2 family endonuclease
MAHLILAKSDLKAIIRDRRERGIDRFDEVWDGIYVISPLANNEHMALVGGLTTGLSNLLMPRDGLIILPGCNVSDRADDWRKNYRCPDVAVFLPGNPAQDRDTHWLGGPDFLAEVVSPSDRSRKKFGFYAAVGVREVALIDRRPWRLELYTSTPEGWILLGTSDPASSEPVSSPALGLTFRLLPGERRPRLEMTHPETNATWLV